MLKVWDLLSQRCVGTYGEQFMSKVTDFTVISELGLLVTASSDKFLRIFSVDQTHPDETGNQASSDIGNVTL